MRIFQRIRQNPVLRKELRSLTRQRPIKALVGTYLIFVLGICGLAILTTGLFDQQSLSTIDRYGIIFATLCFLQAMMITILPVAPLAQSVSGERERQTWDLLRLTDLQPHQILLGKYLAVMAWSLIPALAIVPLQGALIVLGEIPWQQWLPWIGAAALLVWTPGGIGLLCSTLFRSALAARITALSGVMALLASFLILYSYLVIELPAGAGLIQTLMVGLWVGIGAAAWRGASCFLHKPLW